MNSNTGRILKPKEMDKLMESFLDGSDPTAKEQLQHIKPMNLPPTLKQRILGKVGCNDTCPCGSGLIKLKGT